MFSRIRSAFGFALLFALIAATTAYAKGSFSFITITGSNLKDALRVTNPALTKDFFAFADFYEDKTEAPADPGSGYEITRYYIDGKNEQAFDHLHYYPETGFVYYDGIIDGSSEYDGKWYTAKPEIKVIFDNAISDQSRLSISVIQTQSMLSIAVIGSLAVILVLAFWRRKPVTR